MKKKILWLEDDMAYSVEYKKGMPEDFEMTLVHNVTDAEREIKEHQYDLLILDVMIPIWDQELKDYPPDLTESGYKTGLVFFKRMKSVLEEKNTPVFVVTMFMDDKIMHEFIGIGLQSGCFATKYSLREMGDFRDKITELLSMKEKGSLKCQMILMKP
jgi:CheY-like chemotaxis protein